MEQGSVAQVDGLIGFALLVDQQWEIDLSILAEVTGVLDIAQSDGDKLGALLLKVLLVLAQLRDMLAAKDSAPVAKKNNDCRSIRPERAKTRGVSVHIGKSNAG